MHHWGHPGLQVRQLLRVYRAMHSLVLPSMLSGVCLRWKRMLLQFLHAPCRGNDKKASWTCSAFPPKPNAALMINKMCQWKKNIFFWNSNVSRTLYIDQCCYCPRYLRWLLIVTATIQGWIVITIKMFMIIGQYDYFQTEYTPNWCTAPW